jgi:hypothetical protein
MRVFPKPPLNIHVARKRFRMFLFFKCGFSYILAIFQGRNQHMKSIVGIERKNYSRQTQEYLREER